MFLFFILFVVTSRYQPWLANITMKVRVVVCNDNPTMATFPGYKEYQMGGGEVEVAAKTFMMHRRNVLDALDWLKNTIWNTRKDISICESNLSWISDGIER